MWGDLSHLETEEDFKYSVADLMLILWKRVIWLNVSLRSKQWKIKSLYAKWPK